MTISNAPARSTIAAHKRKFLTALDEARVAHEIAEEKASAVAAAERSPIIRTEIAQFIEFTLDTFGPLLAEAQKSRYERLLTDHFVDMENTGHTNLIISRYDYDGDLESIGIDLRWFTDQNAYKAEQIESMARQVAAAEASQQAAEDRIQAAKRADYLRLKAEFEPTAP